VTLYVLDTDHLSLNLRGHPKIRERLTEIPHQQIAITIVTAEEQLRGRLAQIRKATSGDARSTAYRYFHKAINDLAKLRILDFDAASDLIFEDLRRRRLRCRRSARSFAALLQ
jgi:tRNA(fMet)-specific endonuclease VapC